MVAWPQTGHGRTEWVGSKLSCLYKIQSTTAPAARSRSRSFICVLKLLTYFDPSSSQHQQHFYRHQSKIFIKWKMIMWRICVSQWRLTSSISWSWPLQSLSGSRVVECSMQVPCLHFAPPRSRCPLLCSVECVMCSGWRLLWRWSRLTWHHPSVHTCPPPQ